MPSGGGLRKCKCGEFYLLADAIALGLDADSDTPSAQFILAADLSDATHSPRKAVELLARRQYWMHLNEPYRKLYRAHRQAEDQATQEKWDADWAAVNPNQRSALRRFADRVLRKKQVSSPPMDTRPFSVPPYEPTEPQVENMARLLDLILEEMHEPYGPNMLEVAELYRELGRFKEASDAHSLCLANDIGVPVKLMERLIREGQRAPIRYRL